VKISPVHSEMIGLRGDH